MVHYRVSEKEGEEMNSSQSRRIAGMKYYSENKEKVKETSREYYKRNSIKQNKYHKDLRENRIKRLSDKDVCGGNKLFQKMFGLGEKR